MGNKHSKERRFSKKEREPNSSLENTLEPCAVFDYLPYHTIPDNFPYHSSADYFPYHTVSDYYSFEQSPHCSRYLCIGTDSDTENEDEQTLGNNTVYHVRALDTMKDLEEGHLSFFKGDIFRTENCSLDEWIEAVNLRTNEKGLIPGNCVRLMSDHPTSWVAYYPIDRVEAEEKLLLPGQDEGTYIVRPQTNIRGYALSVLGPRKGNTCPVMHYQIKSSYKKDTFSLERGVKFPSMQALIDHYSEKHRHVNFVLTVPCPRRYKPPAQFIELEVERSSIQLGDQIGKGFFGAVHKGKWYKTVEVAIKVLHAAEDRDKFLQEAKLMHQLHHEHLVKLIGVCTKPASEPLLIITELMPKGNLLSFLQSIKSQKLTVQDYISMMRQIASGMKYLHSKNFIHRDLRAVNVLVGRDNLVKVADFGLVVLAQNTRRYKATRVFPVKWTAPESALPPHTFSIKSDVWSFGVLMYEIVNPSHTVYEGIPQEELPQRLKDGYRMSNPVPGNPDITKIYECILQCWAESPHDRPCFRELHSKFRHWKYEGEKDDYK